MGLILVIIAVVAVYYIFFKSKGSTSVATDNEVGRLLKDSRFYAENKKLFDYIQIKNQPRYKVELLLQSLELGHELESGGYYIIQSIEEGLPYFVETEDEYDRFHKDEEPVLLGSLSGIQSLLFGYFSDSDEDYHPGKLKYWQDKLVHRAEDGDMETQAFLGTQTSQITGISKETAEKYKDTVWQQARAGDAAAQFAVGKYLAPYASDESIQWLTKAAEQGMSDAWYMLGRIYNGLHHRGRWDENAKVLIPLSEEEKSKIDGKDVECWLRGAEADKGVMAGYCQYMVAGFYEDGDYHLPRNMHKAESWYRKAAAHGVKRAKSWLSSHSS